MSESAARRRAEAFLKVHLPRSDLDCYPWTLFEQFIDHALALREAAPWCGALDWEVFAHYVLFPRVNDEDLSFHREIFRAALWSRIKDLPDQEARVLEVNRWCHEHASYQAQDGRTASPLTVYRCGSGRCGEESAFLVSALRSVGIAARQVYVPRWSHCDDNHAWAEALCGDTWRFLGACEPEPVLDRGWFTAAASRAVLVHSRIFGEGRSPLHGEPLSRDGEVTWFNQTARYAATNVRTFRALLPDGTPAPGAQIALQILNEADFRTVAVLTADGEGRAAAELGGGDLHVEAALDGLAAEGDCGPEGIALELRPPQTEEVPWTDFDFHAPADLRPAPEPLNGARREERAETRRQGDALRRARLDGLFQPGRPEWEELLRAARGNCSAVRTFLEGERGGDRRRLAEALTDKDLRDVSGPVLEDHFRRLPPRREDVPEAVYWQYVACPRVALERLTPWRGPLAQWLGEEIGDPAALTERLSRELTRREPAYGNLYWTPEGALEAGACDERSRALLLVAALRTLGVPSRLRPLDGAPEYWTQGGFRPVFPEAAATLRLTAPEGAAPRHGQDWSLSRRTAEGWQPLTTEGEWRDGALTLTLPAGRYRLITTVRLPAGDQLAARRELTLKPGEVRTAALRLRPWSVDDLLSRQSLPAVPGVTPAGETAPDLFRTGEPVLALWLEEGGEPTEHLLNELRELREAFPVQIALLPRRREGLNHPTLASAAALDRAQVLWDDWAYDLEAVARQLGRDPDSPPLAVLADGNGQAVYSASGYRVGLGNLLLQISRRSALQEIQGP